MRHWQIALGRIRLRGPDEPHFNKDVKYVYNHIAQLEAKLREIADGRNEGKWANLSREELTHIARAALQEKGD